MKDPSRLQALKQKMLHDIELAPVDHYFMDHFGDHPEFIELSEKCRHEALEAIIARIAVQLFPGESVVTKLLLMRVASQQFIHGSVVIGRRPGLVLYFEDAEVGLMAVSERAGPGETKYVHFSGQPIQRRGDPDMN